MGSLTYALLADGPTPITSTGQAAGAMIAGFWLFSPSLQQVGHPVGNDRRFVGDINTPGRYSYQP